MLSRQDRCTRSENTSMCCYKSHGKTITFWPLGLVGYDLGVVETQALHWKYCNSLKFTTGWFTAQKLIITAKSNNVGNGCSMQKSLEANKIRYSHFASSEVKGQRETSTLSQKVKI